MTGIPHLQFDWSGDETESNLRKYHYSVNVAPAEHVLSNAMWDILKSKDFDWKSFTIVYESTTSRERVRKFIFFNINYILFDFQIWLVCSIYWLGDNSIKLALKCIDLREEMIIVFFGRSLIILEKSLWY